MKTKEQVQAAVEEIHQVLVKHGLLMVGTCWSEAIYGQITFFDAEDATTHDWRGVPGQLIRKLEAGPGSNFYIYGAGTFSKTPTTD